MLLASFWKGLDAFHVPSLSCTSQMHQASAQVSILTIIYLSRLSMFFSIILYITPKK